MEQNKSTKAQGWQQMQSLLDQEMPVKNVSNNNNKRKYSVLLLLLLIGSCGVYKFWMDDNTDHKQIVISKIENKSQTSKALNINTETSKQTQNSPNMNTLKENGNALNELGKPMNEFGTSRKDLGALQKENGNSLKDLRKSLNDFGKTLKEVGNTQKTNKNTQNIVKKQPILGNNGSSLDKNKPSLGENSSTFTERDLIKTENSNTTFKPSSTKNTDGTNQKLNVPEKVEENISVKNKTEIGNNKNSNNIESKKATPIAKPNNKMLNLNYGVEWSLPYVFNNNSVENYTSSNHPLLSFLPSVWVSKSLKSKSKIQFKFNPYHQFLLNKTIQSDAFNAVTQTASNSTNNADKFEQTTTINKLIGLDISATYFYQLNKKWSLGVGLGNSIITSAIANEVVIKNQNQTITNNYFEIDKNRKEWQKINANFLTTQFIINYNFKKYDIGVRVVKPLSDVAFDQSPINYQLFFSWKLK